MPSSMLQKINQLHGWKGGWDDRDDHVNTANLITTIYNPSLFNAAPRKRSHTNSK